MEVRGRYLPSHCTRRLGFKYPKPFRITNWGQGEQVGCKDSLAWPSYLFLVNIHRDSTIWILYRILMVYPQGFGNSSIRRRAKEDCTTHMTSCAVSPWKSLGDGLGNSAMWDYLAFQASCALLGLSAKSGWFPLYTLFAFHH